MHARFWLSLLLLGGGGGAGAEPLSDAEKEDFLRTAEIVQMESLEIGVTNSRRATCVLDGFRHDAHVQTIDRFEPFHRGARGVEVNFRDYYGFNVAAYRLDRLLGLNMVPVSVLRKVQGEEAAVTWWIDDVLMLEKERWQKDIDPPDARAWNYQMWNARVLNELTFNTDPNLGNVVIDERWKVWLIDFTRAFRSLGAIREKKNLSRIERGLLERLRGLSDEEINEALGDVLSKPEVRGLSKRRDSIVEHFEELIAEKGEGAVVYDER